MNLLVFRSINEPIREDLSWNERWRGDDKGLIKCWETGRKLRNIGSDLVEKAERGELPVLGWKGGVERKIIKGEKYGTLNYLAEWQGLRGEDLNIDPTKEIELVCTKTGMRIIYTSDQKKYANA